jgi:hypothetical protein
MAARAAMTTGKRSSQGYRPARAKLDSEVIILGLVQELLVI